MADSTWYPGEGWHPQKSRSFDELREDAARKAMDQEDLGQLALKRNTAVGLREQAAQRADRDTESLEQAADPFEAMRTYKRVRPYRANWGERGSNRLEGDRQTEAEYRKMVEDAPFPDEASRKAYEAAVQQAPENQAKADFSRLLVDQILRRKK